MDGHALQQSEHAAEPQQQAADEIRLPSAQPIFIYFIIYSVLFIFYLNLNFFPI